MKYKNARGYDKALQIHTTSVVDRPPRNVHYHHYEATPYRFLDVLFEDYKLKKSDGFVDFGCGKGRVLFYVHHRFHCSVAGVEMDEQLYRLALDNEANYMSNAKMKKSGPIRIECRLAEDYEVGNHDNRFFFFNPFSLQIFRKVVGRILHSIEQHSRETDIILYYPSEEYVIYLQTETPFRLVKEVKVPHLNKINPSECFLIFRYGQ